MPESVCTRSLEVSSLSMAKALPNESSTSLANAFSSLAIFFTVWVRIIQARNEKEHIFNELPFQGQSQPIIFQHVISLPFYDIN